ncbi:MAG: hypothetical protein Q8R05_04995 [Candidatus Omnitrophota bacterium]|nr:hypothetical protein [Candidatus Omnitrophota bacterium]
MANIKAGVYRPIPKRLRIREKEPAKMVKVLSLNLQFVARLLARYIKEAYASDGLKAIDGLMPQIIALDKVCNTYLKVIQKGRSMERIKQAQEPTLGDLILSKEGTDDR